MTKPTSAFLFSLVFISIAACENSHVRGDTDSGPRARIDATVVGAVDAAVGAVDAALPDAGCPGGVCACPDDLNPWDPTSPSSQCSVEGARCGSNGGACGGLLSCTCTAGAWGCLVAEPDPACTCGREPTLGGPCSEDGMSCGTCCPAPGEWSPMRCVDGAWEAGLCPPVLCPSGSCPADRREAVGSSCTSSGARCGSACCSSAIECDPATNRWIGLPDADCICNLREYDCGGGSCAEGQNCVGECGPADGVIFTCENPPAGCTGCGCYTDPGLACEERDGNIFVRTLGFCG